MSTGHDERFESLVGDFAKVEADENKNVDEQESVERATWRKEIYKKIEKVLRDHGIPIHVARDKLYDLLDAWGKNNPNWGVFRHDLKIGNPDDIIWWTEEAWKHLGKMKYTPKGPSKFRFTAHKKGLEKESQEATEGKNPSGKDDEKTRNKKLREEAEYNPYELYEEDPTDPQCHFVEKERKEVEREITKVLEDAAKSIYKIKNAKKYGVGDTATDEAIMDLFYDYLHL